MQTSHACVADVFRELNLHSVHVSCMSCGLLQFLPYLNVHDTCPEGVSKDCSSDEGQSASEADEEATEEEFKEWIGVSTFGSEELLRINHGWTAYLIGVVNGRAKDVL